MKKIISLFLCVLMLASAIPATALNAKKALPFDDLTEGSWYYDAALWCYENGYMKGTTATTFEPGTVMTRAMMATLLAAVDGADLSGYTTSSFDDVAVGKWYAPAVEWAYRNGIVSGVGDNMFAPGATLSREQLVVMMYAFMKYREVDVTKVNDKAFERFVDGGEAHTWATEAMTWAATYGVVSGTAVEDGDPYISPRTPATRAQIAVLIRAAMNKNFDGAYPINNLLLGGTDISEFSIVYGTTAKVGGSKIALDLQEYIKQATGETIPVYADNAQLYNDGAHEILIGRTNREGTAVTIDRTDLKGDDLVYEMRGNFLLIYSSEEYAGTAYAEVAFLENVLGFTFYGNGIQSILGQDTVEIADGTVFTDSPFMEFMCNYQMGGGDYHLGISDEMYSFCNVVHTIVEFAQDDYEDTWDYHLKYYLQSDCCLSDSHNIENIKNNVKTKLRNHPRNNLVWLTQCDGVAYCKCDDCAKIYRLWGRCATYVQIVNYVADAIKDEFPDYYVVGLAYKYTITPPKTDISDADYNAFVASYTEESMVPPKDITAPANAIMCVCTDNSCFSHAIDDPNCKNSSNSNVKFNEKFQQWCNVFENIYVWDYVNGDDYTQSPFPNTYEMWQNYNYYYRMGVKGMYVLGISDKYSDFGELRTYLAAELSWDSAMTWDEYSNKVNSFLAEYYGQGWTYIRAYIDLIEELSSKNEWHIWSKNAWDDCITEADYRANIDRLLGYWERAYELADSDERRDNIRYSSVAIKYVELQLAYRDYKASADPADLESFKTLNQAFTDLLDECGYHVPSNWTLEADPDTWKND